MNQTQKQNSQDLSVSANYELSWQVEEEIEVTDAPPEPISRWQVPESASGREELAYQQMFKIMGDMRQALLERDQALSEMQLAQDEILRRLAFMVEWKNQRSECNYRRIGVFAAMLGYYARMTEPECELLSRAAPLRDLGLIGIPDAILHKEGPLNSDEQAVYQLHPAIGAQMLQDSLVPELQLAALIANEHHECFDGSGYPQGLAADDICQSARVVSLVEFYDAKASDYPAESTDEFISQFVEQIKDQSGRAFEPVLCDLLLAQLEKFNHARLTINSRSNLQQRMSGAHEDHWKNFI